MPNADDYLVYQYDDYVAGSVPDDVYQKAYAIVMNSYELVSPALLQRHMSIGFALAARIMDRLEKEGIIEPENEERVRAVIKKAKQD